MRKVLHEDLIYEILAAVGEIPRGKVASYGQIARLIGRDNNARLVGNVLQPCRAVRQLPLPPRSQPRRPPRPNWPEQQHLLEREGIQFKPNGCVDMKRFRWSADPWAFALFPGLRLRSIYRGGRRPCNPVCLALSPYETVQRRRSVRILSMSA